MILMEINSINHSSYQNYNDIPKKVENPKNDEPNQDSEKMLTLSTDDVDSEIEDLKSQRLKLKNAIKTSNDEKLQEQLNRIENELRLKDNDEYRKQHAKVISGIDLKI